MAERSPSTSARDGQAARTVTTKLRYPDFSIRTRSPTLDVAVDDARDDRRHRVPPARPRARATGPGALRLVGVGVKGLEGAQAARPFAAMSQGLSLGHGSSGRQG